MGAATTGHDAFHFEVQHSRQTISALSNTQYLATHELRRFIQIAVGIVCLLLGTQIIGSIKQPINYLFSLYGCFSIAFINVPAKARAERICHQLESSSVGYPCTIFSFCEDGIHITAKGNQGPGEIRSYDDCYRLVLHKGDLYFFVNKDAAFLFPSSALRDLSFQDFVSFLEKKTGLHAKAPNRWYSFTLRDLLLSAKTKKV